MNTGNSPSGWMRNRGTLKKTRHPEEQIAFALKQAETGTLVAEVIRRVGILEQTFDR
jgi:putative transposase